MLLIEGTGPAAVEAVLPKHGDIPVIFITDLAEHSIPDDLPYVVLSKPIAGEKFTALFKQEAPL